MNLYATTKATTPSPRAAMRVRDLQRLLGKMLAQTREEQKGKEDTRTPRHPLYKGRALLILESDKGGGSMKYGWRIGSNSLKAISSYDGPDNRPNMLSFGGPWFNQLADIMENGVVVRVEDDMVLQDLRTELAAAEPEVARGEAVLELKVMVQLVPDHKVGWILDLGTVPEPVTDMPLVVLMAREGTAAGGGDTGGGPADEGSEMKKKAAMLAAKNPPVQVIQPTNDP